MQKDTQIENIETKETRKKTLKEKEEKIQIALKEQQTRKTTKLELNITVNEYYKQNVYKNYVEREHSLKQVYRLKIKENLEGEKIEKIIKECLKSLKEELKIEIIGWQLDIENLKDKIKSITKIKEEIHKGLELKIIINKQEEEEKIREIWKKTQEKVLEKEIEQKDIKIEKEENKEVNLNRFFINLNPILHIKNENKDLKKIKDIWGIEMPEGEKSYLNTLIKEIIAKLLEEDKRMERETYYMEKYETESNLAGFKGKNEIYNKIKQKLKLHDDDLIKEMQKKKSEQEKKEIQLKNFIKGTEEKHDEIKYIDLIKGLEVDVKFVWKNLLRNLDVIYDENKFNFRIDLQNEGITKEMIKHHYEKLIMKPIIKTMQIENFILSLREQFLFYISGWLGSNNAQPKVKMAKLYGIAVINIYEQILKSYEREIQIKTKSLTEQEIERISKQETINEKQGKKNEMSVEDKQQAKNLGLTEGTTLADFLKYTKSNDIGYTISKIMINNQDIIVEIFGLTFLAYWQEHFIKAIQGKQYITKKNGLNFDHGYYFEINENGKIFNELTKKELETMTLKDYKPGPKLTPPKEWENTGKNLKYNYTGGHYINETTPVQAFLKISGKYGNKHDIILYNNRLLESINMAQSCGFVINKDAYEWFYSDKNSMYVKESKYENLLEKKRLVQKEQKDTQIERKKIQKEILIREKHLEERISVLPISIDFKIIQNNVTSIEKENEIKEQEITEEEEKKLEEDIQTQLITKSISEIEIEIAQKKNFLENTKERDKNKQRKLLELEQEIDEQLSQYYRQRKIKQEVTKLEESYKSVATTITQGKVYPFPERPIIYFVTGTDFRGRHAARSSIHPLTEKELRNMLESPWEYELDIETFKQSLITRYVEKALSLEDALKYYDDHFSQEMTDEMIHNYVLKAKEPQGFYIAWLENKKVIKKQIDEKIISNYLVQYDATASAIQLQNLLTRNAFYEDDLNFTKLERKKAIGNVYERLYQGFNEHIKKEYIKIKVKTKEQFQIDKPKYLQILGKNEDNLGNHFNNKKKNKRYPDINVVENEVKQKTEKTITKSPQLHYEALIMFIHDELSILERLDKDKLLKFKLKVAKTVAMQGSYGGQVEGFLKNLTEIFNKYDFFNTRSEYEDSKITLRKRFLDYFWYYLTSESACFMYLKICREINHLYIKNELPIKLNSLGGFLISTAYYDTESRKISRTMPRLGLQIPIKHTTTVSSIKNYDKRKNKNALPANVIQMFDAFIIGRFFSKCRNYYVNGFGLPILTVHDSISCPTILSGLILNIYQEIIFDIFNENGTLQDQDENHLNPDSIATSTRPLIEAYLDQFYEDLEMKLIDKPNGYYDLLDLKQKIYDIMQKISTNSDYKSLHENTLRDGSFVKIC